jgi:hypothetical protein
MAETSTIMGLVGAFIAIAIMLSIGIQILGNVQNGTPCNSLPGFNSTGRSDGSGPFGSFPNAINSPASNFKYSQWSLQCLTNGTSQQSAYTLLGVILIVVAAVAILFVVRLL